MTLGGIAKQHNTTVDHLAKVNHIKDINKIQANKTLLVPAVEKFDVNTPLDDTVANNVADVLWTMESGRGKWLSNKNSTASGHFHWLNGTWQDFQKKYPKETAGMTKANLDDYETALKFQKMKLADDALLNATFGSHLANMEANSQFVLVFQTRYITICTDSQLVVQRTHADVLEPQLLSIATEVDTQRQGYREV